MWLWNWGKRTFNLAIIEHIQYVPHLVWRNTVVSSTNSCLWSEIEFNQKLQHVSNYYRLFYFDTICNMAIVSPYTYKHIPHSADEKLTQFILSSVWDNPCHILLLSLLNNWIQRPIGIQPDTPTSIRNDRELEHDTQLWSYASQPTTRAHIFYSGLNRLRDYIWHQQTETRDTQREKAGKKMMTKEKKKRD